MPKTMTVRIRTCTRCGHTWTPRKPIKPIECPRCKSVRWDRQKEV